MTQAATDYQKSVYQPNLAAGVQFQDFCCIELAKRGVIIQNLQSQKYQLERGENLNGVEIKYDRWFEKSGNLWIETAEKSHPNNPKYVPSGIFAQDEPWLYLIGDYNEFFVFATTRLQEAHAVEEWHKPPTENGSKTSWGFLISRQMAKRMAALHLDFTERTQEWAF